MKLKIIAFVSLVTSSVSSQSLAQNVPFFHGDLAHSGNYVVPTLNLDRAKLLHLDNNFQPPKFSSATLSGHINAQPLYWSVPRSSSGIIFVATEDNIIYAIDSIKGNLIWKQLLGNPVKRSALPCGNISPFGITGTPVIDEASQAIYLDAAIDIGPASGPANPRHRVFGLSLNDGSILPGWPVDISNALPEFISRNQNQRGALAILNGTVYIPFGGHDGDCSTYHGVVVGVSLANQSVGSWSTRARGGGIWAAGGITSDGTSLFVATGNTMGAKVWSDGEAVIRLVPDLPHSVATTDFFTPTNWAGMDSGDIDLGSSNPLPFKLPAPNGNQALIFQAGKDGYAYLLDLNNLGGIGGYLSIWQTGGNIHSAPAAYLAGGGVFITFTGPGYQCPSLNHHGKGLTTIKVLPGSPPKMTTAWCAPFNGSSAPIVTTTDGQSNPIVWAVGASGDKRLHGFDGNTGLVIFNGPSMSGLEHFQTLIATDARLYVAADGTIYSYTFEN
jgi:outer membrane protein assembly factor BamB